jgi:hypothetical protein
VVLFWVVVVGVVMCMCVGCLVFLLCGEWVVRLIVWVRGSVVLSNHKFQACFTFNNDNCKALFVALGVVWMWFVVL